MVWVSTCMHNYVNESWLTYDAWRTSESWHTYGVIADI